MLRDQSPQIALFGFSLLRTSAGFQDDEFFSNAPRTQRPTDATGLQLSLFKQTFPRSLELLSELLRDWPSFSALDGSVSGRLCELTEACEG